LICDKKYTQSGLYSLEREGEVKCCYRITVRKPLLGGDCWAYMTIWNVLICTHTSKGQVGQHIILAALSTDNVIHIYNKTSPNKNMNIKW